MSSASVVSSNSNRTRIRRWSWLTALVRPADDRRACLAILFVYCSAFFWYGLTVGDLYRTETLRAIIAEEFLRSGNWIVPRLYGQPLFTKPPGMYAAIAACSWPFGQVTDFSARLPSALAATALVFLFYWYVGRQLGRLGGLLAALILPMSAFFLEKASAAEIDMLHVVWTAASILFFLRALEAETSKNKSDLDKCAMLSRRKAAVAVNGSAQPRKHDTQEQAPCFRGTIDTSHASGGFGRESMAHKSDSLWDAPLLWWLLAFACFAGGLMTKWTTPAFFYLTALPLLWRRGQLRLLWCWRHVAGVALVVAVFAAWAIAAVMLEGWHVFYATIMDEAAQRLAPGYTPRPYPWLESLMHPLKLLVVMLPFSIVALWSLRPSFFQLWNERERNLLIALHCWAWPNLIFWCLPTEHTPRHSAPLFPAVAGLAAMVVLAWMTGKLPWRWARIRPHHLVIAGLVMWFGFKTFYIHGVMTQRTINRQTRHKGELLASLIPIGDILYIFRIKDEGVMFYYGRTVRRLASPEKLPKGAPAYCIVTEEEYKDWPASLSSDVVRRMTDAQGDPIVLIRVTGS